MHDNKYKILCLHGIGTNADIFEAQTASLRYHLTRADPTSSFDFDFLDGTYPWPARPAITGVYGTGQAYLSYCDGSAPSALDAINNLAAYILEYGPFDAIMGFSMGSLIAATLLLQPRECTTDKPEWAAARTMVRVAVFLSGIRPLSPLALQRGQLEKITSQDISSTGRYSPIKTPSVHFWDMTDQEIPGESKALADMCVKDTRTESLHLAGHAVPSAGAEVKAVAVAIHKILPKCES